MPTRLRVQTTAATSAHYPAVLLGLLAYGYANGAHSSRKIERANYDPVAFRYVAGEHASEL